MRAQKVEQFLVWKEGFINISKISGLFVQKLSDGSGGQIEVLKIYFSSGQESIVSDPEFISEFKNYIASNGIIAKMEDSGRYVNNSFPSES